MAVKFVELDEAKRHDGIVLVAPIPGVPNPYAEAAKAILQLKGLEFVAVHLDYADSELLEWAGNRGAPVVKPPDSADLDRWNDILLYAERCAPHPRLLPEDAEQRADALGLCHEICGEGGLGWTRRLDLVHRGMQGRGFAFNAFARGLGARYGYRPEDTAGYTDRIVALLSMLSNRLRRSLERGHGYYMGPSLSAVDVYSATFMVQFCPLPGEQCDMLEDLRRDFETFDPRIEQALDPIVLDHRDRVYGSHLELPLSLRAS